VNKIGESEDKQRIVKLRVLGTGLILIFIAILLLQFFHQLRFPRELFIPENIRRSQMDIYGWTFDENYVRTMRFVGDVGYTIGGILFLLGLVFVAYGFINRLLDKHLTIPQRFDQGIIESIQYNLETDKNFILLFLATVIFALMWAFNLLTYPDAGPLYFLRETSLQAYFPDVAVETLPAFSTYGAFAVIQDTSILLFYIYVIYVRLRPGKQFGEDFVSFALERTLFLIILISVTLFHGIGHLPFELYGQGQWGTGYTDISAWIAFDKIAHGLTSVAITMLFVYIVTDQFSKYGAKNTASTLFALLVAVALMISLGLFWEIYEWITNLLLNLGHFEDEVLDAPKDLVWDALGAIIGAGLAMLDMHLSREESKSDTIEA
jgi:hypothetical protein